MKIVKYLLRRTVPFFLISMLLVGFILNLIDLFMNITKYMEMDASVISVLRVMVYYIPKTIWYAAPIAFLFSVTYILSDLYATNEMEAIFASGISLYRFIAPLVVFSIFCSVAMLFFEDKVVVNTLKKKTELQEQLIGTQKSENNNNIVVQSNGGKIIYKVGHYDHQQKRIECVCYFIFRDDEKNLEAILIANWADWDEENQRWQLFAVREYVPENNTLVFKNPEEKYIEQLTENYEIFKRANINVESETISDAKIYIDHLKKAGLPYYEPMSVYLKKFAFPFIFLIAGLLAVGVTGRTKKNVLLISLSLSVASVVLFYVFQMCTMVLAKTQVLTPFMGAWFPDIVFTIIAVFLIKNQRT